jgi:ribosomal protein L29
VTDETSARQVLDEFIRKVTIALAVFGVCVIVAFGIFVVRTETTVEKVQRNTRQIHDSQRRLAELYDARQEVLDELADAQAELATGRIENCEGIRGVAHTIVEALVVATSDPADPRTPTQQDNYDATVDRFRSLVESQLPDCPEATP